MSKLLEHFKRMQAMALAYILPAAPYVDRDGKRSDDHGGEKRGVRDNLFANDMIYMLDGPEQREAVADACADADKAMVIAEHGFRAGYKSAADRARAFHPTRIESDTAHMDAAWAEYELPEPLPELS